MARQIGQETPFPSLEVATEDFTGYVGGCSPGYACAYMNTISWSSADDAAADGDQPARGVRAAVRAARHAGPAHGALRSRTRASSTRSSRGLEDLERGLGARDRERLDEYLDNVREIEQRIQRTESAEQHRSRSRSTRRSACPSRIAEHVGLMFDLMAVAYQTDMTRVFTFMMAREASIKTYPEIGITEPHHALSHHRKKPDVRWRTRRSTPTTCSCSPSSSRS